MLCLLVALTPVVLIGQSGLKDDAADLAAIRSYRTWHQATKGFVDMLPSISMLCVGPPKELRPPNPHVPRVFRVFVNRVGEKTMKGKGAFPVGSILVKEKHIRNAEGDRYKPVKIAADARPELFTVMRKGPKGWDWYSVSGDGKSLARDTGSCRSCHAGAKATDYVFKQYGW